MIQDMVVSFGVIVLESHAVTHLILFSLGTPHLPPSPLAQDTNRLDNTCACAPSLRLSIAVHSSSHLASISSVLESYFQQPTFPTP